MRIGVTLARLQSGKWDVLALPDTPIGEQKKAFKDIVEAKGKSGKKNLSELYLLVNSGVAKRKKFHDTILQSEIKADDSAVE